MKASVLRYAAIGMASLSLAGFAAASSVNVGTTGPESNNQFKFKNHNSYTGVNTNLVGVNNFNAQGAASGHVSAVKNTSVDGGVGSGAARNENMTTTAVGITNTPSAAMLGALGGSMAGSSVNATFDTTGPESNNTVSSSNKNTVTTVNTNAVNVNNVNVQGAHSGSVSAYKNTTVGGMTSGAASNSSTTTSTVNIGN
jgi:hypothetical protein